MPTKDIPELQKLIYENALAKGFHDGQNSVWKMLGNIHAEVSEAWEECRRADFDPKKIHYPDIIGPGELPKPEGFPIELADIVIRCLDTAEVFGIDLYTAILEKMAYNTTRPHRHGNKRA